MTVLETIIKEVESETIAPKLSFSTLNPKLQLAWDATSYGNLEKCPRYYELASIKNYRLNAPTPHLDFGTYLHSAVETYDRHRAKGLNHNQSLLAAFRLAILDTWDFEKGRPWVSSEPQKTRDTLLRSIVWYLDTFQNDKLETVILSDGRPAVELSFRLSLNNLDPSGEFRSSTDEEYLLCGHLDKVVRWNGELRIKDYKTSKHMLDDIYFLQFSPDNQVSIYSIAGNIILETEISGFIIDAIQVLVEGTRFRRKPIERTADQLEEWLKNFKIKLRENETYVENDYWPQNTKSCGFGTWQCQFRSVCSADPSARQDILDNFYIHHTWDPLKPR